MGKINKEAYVREFIRAMLKNEAEKIDRAFMNMDGPQLPIITPETPVIRVECECCGRPVKVPRYQPGYEPPDLAKTICPFCGKPLQLNIPMSGMVQ